LAGGLPPAIFFDPHFDQARWQAAGFFFIFILSGSGGRVSPGLAARRRRR